MPQADRAGTCRDRPGEGGQFTPGNATRSWTGCSDDSAASQENRDRGKTEEPFPRQGPGPALPRGFELLGGPCWRVLCTPPNHPPQPQAEPMKWSFVPGSPGVQISPQFPSPGP